MKCLLIILLLFPFSTSIQAQRSADTFDIISCYFPPMPAYPGGFDSLNAHVNKNFNWKNIPYCFEGKVFVKVQVDEKGKLIEAKVMKGISEAVDKEVLRIIKQVQEWIPGREGSKPVESAMVFPVRFLL